MLLCVLRAIVLAILCCRVRILTNTTREGRRHGGLEEAGRVRCRLSAKLGKIEVGACSVADIHGLPELALGVEAVEDDCIDGDGYGFHNNFDDTADKRPLLFQKLASSTILRRREMNWAHLKPANKSVANIVMEQLASLVVIATPAPDILSITIRLAAVEDSRTNAPHDNTEGEECDGEDCVVNRCLLCSLVTASPICPYDSHGHCERNTRDTQKDDLRPCRRAACPWR